MKKLLFILVVLLYTFTAHAQTPSQASDNGYLNVQFLGYIDGKYEFQLSSNQVSCNSGKADIAVSATNTTISKISPNDAGEFSTANIRVTSGVYVTYITAPWSSSAMFTFTELTTCDWHGNPTPIKVGVLLSS